MAKTAKKKAVKITASSKRRSRGDTVKTIAAATDLKTGQVRAVFETLTQIIAADLSKGSGEFNFNGLMKLRTVKKPATSARKGRNPFTGEEIMIKAKPASRKVRVRALRNLNGLIQTIRTRFPAIGGRVHSYFARGNSSRSSEV